MPYIKQDRRAVLDPAIQALVEQLTHFSENKEPVVGEVNYVISKLLVGIVRKRGISYTLANNLSGVLPCVDKEFYRRWVAPYEDEKIKENGDI